MPSRYHYLDAARAILMILGIAYHAARVYGDGTWVIADTETNPLFVWLAAGLTRFRMPAFFLMSGFFAARTLRHHGPRALVVKRAPRLLIPFTVTLLSLNVIQLWVLNVYHGGQPAGVSYLWSRAMWGDFSSDRWVSHLWFLMCLAYYIAALGAGAALVRPRASPTGVRRLAAVGAGLASRPAIVLLLLPIANVAIQTVFWALPVLYSWRPIISMDDLGRHLPYFSAGLLLFASPRLYESMTRFNGGVAALTAVTAIVLAGGWTRSAGAASPLLTAYAGFLATWLTVYWVLVFFRAILDRPSATAAMLAESAYTIYLFHHLTVVLIAWWLIHTGLGPVVKFTLVVSLTFAATLAIHRVAIAKVPLLALLFNGRPRRPPPRAAPVETPRAAS